MSPKIQPPIKSTVVTSSPISVDVPDDLKPGIYRTISISTYPQGTLSPPVFIPLDDGTPQKRLASLLEMCIEIQNANKQLTNKKLETLKTKIITNDFITNIKDSSRAEIFKNETEKNNFTEYIQTFINTLNSKQEAFKNPLIIELWSQILIKSLSDISQFGCLLNNIPNIYTQTNTKITTIENITKYKNNPKVKEGENPTVTKVLRILNYNKNIVFVSSDKIAAGLSTNISKLIDYPIQTLCSRKTGVTTQTIIVQKSAISALAVVLSYINDADQTLKLCEDIFIYQTQNGMGTHNGENITNLIIDINNIIVQSYNILKNVVEPNFDITNNIQIIFDELFMNLKIQTNLSSSSPSDDKITKYKEFVCSIIDQISKIENLNDYLNEISKTLINYDYIKIPRWCYHLSNDIYKYKFALSSDMFNDNLKQDISKQEILSASFDAMYGHDFKLQIITQLGEYFLTAIQEINPYSIDDSISISAMEDTCIKQTLQLNNFSTINQDGDSFSVCFNPEINYLIVNKTEMLYRESEIPWNITFSPLVRQPIYAAVDFVSGEPSISVILSQQVNFIKQQEINKEEILPFSLLDVTNEQTLVNTRNEINKNTIYNEFYSVMTLFDGAAPYGGKPFYILDNYDIEINFGREGKGKLKVTTLDNKIPETDLDANWFKSRIETINSDFLNVFRALDDNTKSILINKDFEPAFKLNQIFGTILNSANRKLSKTTAQSIFTKFNQLVGEIKNRVSLLGQEGVSRSRRAPQNNGHFLQNEYQEFSSYGIIDKLDEIIASIYESDLTNFNALLLEYIKIVTETFENKEDPEYIKKTYLLLQILEVTVKTIFTENLSGLFVSLYYANSGDLEKLTDDKIKQQIQIIYDQLAKARHLVELTNSFVGFMREKENNQRSIFTPIKLTDTEPIQRAYFSDPCGAYNTGNINNQVSSPSFSPLISSALNKDLNTSSEDEKTPVATQRDSAPNTGQMITVPGPFAINTPPQQSYLAPASTTENARLIELQEENEKLNNNLQEKDIEINNLKEDIERLKKSSGTKRESELILESQSPRFSKTEEGKSQIKGGNCGGKNNKHKITFKNRQNKKVHKQSVKK